MDGVCHLSSSVSLSELIELVVQVLLHLLQPTEISVPVLQGTEQEMKLFVWEVSDRNPIRKVKLKSEHNLYAVSHSQLPG